MAKPLRFRRSEERWTEGRVEAELYRDLNANIGAESSRPWFKQPEEYAARRFDMDNGDVALFCWTDDHAYWVGNTETPEALWRTDKERFSRAPQAVSEWAQRELLAHLHERSPWLKAYQTLSRFFLPVLLSKDGRETTREFFREYAAGFPDADMDTALRYYEEFLESSAIDDRHLMASKLGTAEQLELARMSAAMSEFTVAKLLHGVGYEMTPEHEVSTGHSIDFEASRGNDESVLVEVTRPIPVGDRSANSPVEAIRQTVETKTSGQLSVHGGGIVLFVDCSSFQDGDWQSIRREGPDVGHRPAVVFRVRPPGDIAGYTRGRVPLDLPDGID